jgi:DNA-binding NarL/FixJ family response regulator
MSPTPIRLLIVDADPGGGSAYQDSLAKIEGVEIVGVARNKKTALEQADSIEFDVALVDVMLTGYRSVDVIGAVSTKQPDIRILALTPGDPPHDRVILAVEAGALGYITRDADPSEALAAIKQAQQGKPWLPLDETYEVLQEAAPELGVSVKERNDRLTQVILGLVPLTGLVAAITALLWREYWKDIGVRVVDLGVDPTSRMIDVIVFFLFLLGFFGPLFFVDNWLQAIKPQVMTHSALSKTITRGRKIRFGKFKLGKLLFSYTMAWIIVALFVLIVMAVLYQLAQLIVVMFIGPLVGIILLANIMGMEDHLPESLRLSNRGFRRIIAIITILLILFLSILSLEVLVAGPDLRSDGVHGILAPEVLGLSARPVKVFDLDEKLEPLEALYLGGNGDLYVLYDPCEEVTRMVPVGSSRVEVIEQVLCRQPP